MVALSDPPPQTAWKKQVPAMLVGAGHGGTHWILATFYILLPFLSKEFGLSYAAAGALVTLFHASSLTANVASGAIVDIAGRRVVIQALSLVIGASALIAVGFSAELIGVAIAVIFIGFTNNLWHPAAISYLSRAYPHARGLALSIHTLGATFGDLLAPVVAGGLLLVFSWRTVAPISALPVFLVAVLLLIVLRERRSENGDDRITGGAKSYFTGLVGLLRDKALIGLCVMSGFRSMTQNGVLVFLPLYLVGVLEVSPFVLGLVMMTLQVGGIIAGPVAGTLSDRIGRQPVALAGLAATSLAVLSFAFVEAIVPFVILVFVLGFALFSIRPVIHSWTMDITEDHMAGTAVSVLFGTQSAFTLVIPVLGGFIADQWGLQTVFYLLTATVVIATAIAFVLPEADKRGNA